MGFCRMWLHCTGFLKIVASHTHDCRKAHTVWRRYLMLPLGVLMPVGSNASLRFASFTLCSYTRRPA